jgi:cytochrome c oxidase cbb3-type subunit 3
MSARDNDPNRDRLLEHEADGIREFDNALPRWWLYGFYLTIVFAAVYVVNYHLLASPLFGRPGMVAEYEAEVQAATRVASSPAAVPAIALAALRDEPSLAQGRSIFESPDNVCSSCHRADLGGTIGPNLTDEYWLHGCSVQQIVTSIRTGFPMKGMMPFGTGKPLTDAQLLQVASYVMARRGSSPADPKPIDPERDVVCR